MIPILVSVKAAIHHRPYYLVWQEEEAIYLHLCQAEESRDWGQLAQCL